MPVLKGREAEDRRRALVEDKLRRILRGAARAGAHVIAEEAKDRVTSDAVREGVIVGRTKEEGGSIKVRVTVKDGWAKSLGTWLEWGTEGHFISVDQPASGGMTAERVNRLDREAAEQGRAGPGGSLVINGKPVGLTVWHPGARAHPWLRPARDIAAREAVTTAQGYITARVRKSGLIVEEDDA